MLKHRRSGRSRVCGLSNVRWLRHLERFSARLRPKAIISCKTYAKLVEHSKARPETLPKARRCPPLRRPARARLARTASHAPPRRPGDTTRRDSVCCCGRAGSWQRARHRTCRRASGRCTHQPERERGSFPTTIGVRAVSRTRCLCAHSPAASHVSPATAAPTLRRPCAQDDGASLTNRGQGRAETSTPSGSTDRHPPSVHSAPGCAP
jgi:hypothetical protein